MRRYRASRPPFLHPGRAVPQATPPGADSPSLAPGPSPRGPQQSWGQGSGLSSPGLWRLPASLTARLSGTAPRPPVTPSGSPAGPGCRPGPPLPPARCQPRPPAALTSESLRWLRLNSRALPPGRRPPAALGVPGGGCAVAGGGGGGGWGCLLFTIRGPGPAAAGSILAAPHPRLNSRTASVRQLSRDFLQELSPIAIVSVAACVESRSRQSPSKVFPVFVV